MERKYNDTLSNPKVEAKGYSLLFRSYCACSKIEIWSLKIILRCL